MISKIFFNEILKYVILTFKYLRIYSIIILLQRDKEMHMSFEVFLLIYISFMIVAVCLEVMLLSDDGVKYLKVSCNALINIIKNLDASKELRPDILSKELVRFYNEYIQEVPRIKKFYPNVMIWIDAILFRIDCGRPFALALKEHVLILKSARDILQKENPFNKCEKYQQGILCDLADLETPGNKLIINNILNRTEQEFLRLSGDIKKNRELNIISIAIGVIGIIVSFLMATVKF